MSMTPEPRIIDIARCEPSSDSPLAPSSRQAPVEWKVPDRCRRHRIAAVQPGAACAICARQCFTMPASRGSWPWLSRRGR